MSKIKEVRKIEGVGEVVHAKKPNGVRMWWDHQPFFFSYLDRTSVLCNVLLALKFYKWEFLYWILVFLNSNKIISKNMKCCFEYLFYKNTMWKKVLNVEWTEVESFKGWNM